MRILYVIFVLCVAALLWAAIAAARHIRRHEGKAASRGGEKRESSEDTAELVSAHRSDAHGDRK
jgi:hypothetical protein